MAIRCTAKSSRTGKPCQRYAIEGGNVCHTHGGAAPQVKRAAMERILEAAPDVAAELVRIALHGESESVRVSALKDLLDRAGHGAKQKLESEVTVHDGGAVDREIARLTAELAERAAGRTAGGAAVADDSET